MPLAARREGNIPIWIATMYNKFMLRRFLWVIAVAIVAYFVIAGALTLGGICPKYKNLMPRVVSPGEEIQGEPFWHAFCPFRDKVY